jgi:hypothetical protein
MQRGTAAPSGAGEVLMALSQSACSLPCRSCHLLGAFPCKSRVAEAFHVFLFKGMCGIRQEVANIHHQQIPTSLSLIVSKLRLDDGWHEVLWWVGAVTTAAANYQIATGCQLFCLV